MLDKFDENGQCSVSKSQIHTRRQLRLICIGAGIAGIAAAYKYDRQLSNVSFVIYEKNEDVGGTWLENRYPGCACDIPAHGYTYSWEGNPEWSCFYAEAPEIHAYYKSCAEKWNCMRYIKLSHQVTEAKWSSSSSKWDVSVKILATGETIVDECDVLLSATGVLNKWKWPDITGIHDFKGKLLHSARWDNDYSFEGKRVAVIGAGSSAIQIVPKLTPIVAEMVSFIRSRTWITAEFNADLAPQGRETRYSAEQIEKFKTDTQYFLDYRKRLYNASGANYTVYYKDSEKQKLAKQRFTQMMKERLNFREDLCSRIIPEFAVGCRRFTPGTGYLEALVSPNSRVVTTDIECITSGGLRTTDGEEYEVDAIICATGFDTSFKPAFPVIGLNGRNLAEEWKEQPLHYLSVAAPGFPNYFMAGGPNSPISNGSLIAGLETAIDYAYRCITKMQTENIVSLEPKIEAVEDFLEHRDAYMDLMVWSDSCKSWYKNGKSDGPVIGPWIGSTWHYEEALREPRFEDYQIHYLGRNRFAYLGDGRTIGEVEGVDMSAKITQPGVSKLEKALS
ncbi:hypothetical protein PV08_07957 [Exophiala spinifera]|uniref:Uncharacterized protein n=1 Tax=Exophiala spinifera TaxID=91928 RepID=A0A0D2B2C3_9EURO|nr:uncharacterized protein PV08_07957 [Exophiala spinifera]KIW12770.1 hypothetical protein PV08_07957 [Exophiala spinifera]